MPQSRKCWKTVFFLEKVEDLKHQNIRKIVNGRPLFEKNMHCKDIHGKDKNIPKVEQKNSIQYQFLEK